MTRRSTARRALGAVLVGIALSLVAHVAASARAPSIPLPADLALDSPAADVPAGIARFAGAWAHGAWDGVLPHVLVVESVDRAGRGRSCTRSATSPMRTSRAATAECPGGSRPICSRSTVERGFAVLAPMRRGRGASDGAHVEYEGTCRTDLLTPGLAHAIEDVTCSPRSAATGTASWAGWSCGGRRPTTSSGD